MGFARGVGTPSDSRSNQSTNAHLITLMPTYGHFSDDTAEYVITDPHTPAPWINYLTNGNYLALCSHRGGGFSCHLDHRFGSILRRGQQVHRDDTPGRFFYLKDEDSGEIWSLAGHPISGAMDHFEARHGAGYTRITSSQNGIGGEQRYFVPRGHDCEIWSVKLRNDSDHPRRLSLVAYAELMLGNWFIDVNEPAFASLFNVIEQDARTLTYRKQWWNAVAHWDEHNEPWNLRVFATSTRAPDELCASRDAFIGAFRSLQNPVGLESATLPQVAASGRDACMAQRWSVALAPGMDWSTDVVLGVQPSEDSAESRAEIAALQHSATIERLWSETRAWWDGMLDSFHVETPDAEINRMMNVWNKIQVMANFHFGRAPSYFHKQQYPSVRDQCQDTFGVTLIDPDLARGKILHIARFFFSDGRAGAGCNRLGLPEGASIKVDVPLWLILTVADYIKETGDWALLDESLPLLDGGTSTIYEKLKAGMARIATDKGPHGLPLIGRGDWNDAADQIGAQGRGESVWLAQFLVFTVREAAFLFRHQGDTDLLASYEQIAYEQERIVREQCWDGEWFVRAFKDDGTPVGVKGTEEGFIWINSQTWAVMAGVGTPDQRDRAMDSVIEHLETECGLMNLAPAYTKPDPTIGIITAFKPGWKENAAVFSHASAFNVCARAKLGRGSDAVELFRKLLPGGRDPDRYLVEPYVYAQFVAGPAAGDEFGEGAWHWLTGTAAWMIRALSDYIFGVRAEVDGLTINPSVDPAWREWTFTRRFRGSTYTIQFRNPNGAQSGVREIRLDGQPITGNHLPLPTAAEHHVEVTLK